MGVVFHQRIRVLHRVSTFLGYSDTPLDGLSKLLKDHRGTGTITTLRISDPCTSIPGRINDQLVQWPARLVSFGLTRLSRPGRISQYTAARAQQMLDYHRESLENVELGWLRPYRSPLLMPDFSQYPKLRTLQLSSSNLLVEEPAGRCCKVDRGRVDVEAPQYLLWEGRTRRKRCE